MARKIIDLPEDITFGGNEWLVVTDQDDVSKKLNTSRVKSYVDLTVSTASGTLFELISTISGTDITAKADITYVDANITTASGYLQSQISSKTDTIYVDQSLQTLSGTLQSQIGSKSEISYVDSSITVLSGALTDYTDTSITTTSGYLQNQLNTKATVVYVDQLVSTSSGTLQFQIDNKTDETYVDQSISTLSGSLQSQINNKSEITYVDTLITTTSGDLQNQITLKADTSYVDSLTATTSGVLQEQFYLKADTSYVDLMDLTISGALQDQINLLPTTQYVDNEITTISGYLQPQIQTLASIPTINNPVDVTTTSDLHDRHWSAGILSGFDITDNGDGTIDLAYGEAILRTGAYDYSPIVSVSVPAQVGVVLTEGATNYVCANYNAGDPTISVYTSIDSFNCRDICIIWAIARDATDLHVSDARYQNMDANSKHRRILLEVDHYRHVPGGTVLGTSSGRYLNLTAGKFFYGLSPMQHPSFDTSASGTEGFRYYRTDGIGGWIKSEGNTVIDNSQYDNAGTLTAMSNNKFKAEAVYLILDVSAPHLAVIYGQTQYSSYAEANTAAIPTSVPSLISDSGALVGRIIVEKGVTDLSAVQSAFSTMFSFAGTTHHESLAGLLGGAINQHYHLTEVERGAVTNASTPSSSNPFITSTVLSTTSGSLITSITTVSGYLQNQIDTKITSAYVNQELITLSGTLQTDISSRLLVTDIDDIPVNGETQAPISSNWAYDHTVTASGTHGVSGSLVGTTDEQLLYNKTLSNYKEALYTTSVSGTAQFELSNGNVQRLTLNADTQLILPIITGGVSESFILILDCGGFIVSWGSSPAIEWLTSDGVSPTLVVTSGLVNVITFVVDTAGNRWLGFFAGKETA